MNSSLNLKCISMTQNGKIFIKDIEENKSVDSPFLVKEMSLYETKAGKPYLRLILMDKTGEAPAMVWDNANQVAPFCQPGSISRFVAQVQSYKGALQLKVVRVEEINPDEVELESFMPATSFDISDMVKELKGLIESVRSPHLHSLLLSFVNDRKLWDLIVKAPAAKRMHHAYIGGLLEHTLGICRAVDKISGLYPGVDRDLLMAGAFLHDIGKIREFSFAIPPFNYSDEGRLLGHMAICLEILGEKIAALPDFPEQTALLLKHLILSHHGRYEYGSPSLPMTKEAFVLNFLDDLDAKMNYLDRLSSKSEDDGYQWTDYQRNMERFLYLSGHPAQQEDSAPGRQTAVEPVNDLRRTPKSMKEQSVNRQPTLWD